MTKIVFCSKCHREAYKIIESKDTLKIIQGEKTMLNIGRSSNISMALNCPNGHPVKLEIDGGE